jgi:hypothetical protein
MTQVNVKHAFLATVVFACGALATLAECEPRNGLLVSIGSMQARVGRPLTPVSVAGCLRSFQREC